MQKKILEAALFISSRPLDLNDLAKILGVSSLGYVKQLIEDLQKEYAEKGIEIVKTPEGWQMQVKPEFLDKVSHLTPYSDLSEGCKRTLALVVYKEPVKQAEIIKIQGNKAYSYIKYLERKGLIKTEKVKNTKILRTTEEFEKYFGEEKEKIKEAINRELQSLEQEPKEEPQEVETEKEEIQEQEKPQEREYFE